MRVRDRAEKLVKEWLKSANNATILLTPTTSKLNYLNDPSNDPFITLIPVFTVAGFSAISMPVGFSKSSYSKNELPVGMLLWSNSVDDVFAVAKYIDSRSGKTPQVPPYTPILDEKSSIVSIHLSSFLIPLVYSNVTLYLILYFNNFLK